MSINSGYIVLPPDQCGTELTLLDCTLRGSVAPKGDFVVDGLM
jgi:hypothetical protein